MTSFCTYSMYIRWLFKIWGYVSPHETTSSASGFRNPDSRNPRYYPLNELAPPLEMLMVQTAPYVRGIRQFGFTSLLGARLQNSLLRSRFQNPDLSYSMCSTNEAPHAPPSQATLQVRPSRLSRFSGFHILASCLTTNRVALEPDQKHMTQSSCPCPNID